MRKFAFLLLFMCGISLTNAQKAEIGQLKKKLQKDLPAKKSVDVMNRLAMLSHLRQRDSCLYYAERALAKSTKIQYSKGIADALNNLGVYSISLNNYQSARYFTDALEIYRQLGDVENESQMLMNLSVLLFVDKNENEARRYIYKAEKLSRNIKNDSIRSIILTDILTLDRNISPQRYKAIMAQGIAVARRHKDYPMIVSFMNNEGTILYNEGQKQRGLDVLLESERLADSVGCEYVKVSAIMTIGEMYLDLGKDAEGTKYYEKGLQVSDKFGYPERSLAFAERLYRYYTSKNNDKKALQYAELIFERRDRIAKATQKTGFNFVSYVQKENEIKNMAQQRRNKNLLIGALSFLLLLSLAGIFMLWRFYRNKRALAKAESKLKASLEAQKLELESRNDFKKMLISVLAHDVRQPFANIIMATDLLSQHPEIVSEADRNKIFSELRLNAEQSIFFMDGVLYWIKARRQGVEMSTERLSLNELLRESNLFLEPLQKQRDILIRNELKGDEFVFGNQMVLTFAIRNILHNATKFSPEGTSIWIGLKDSGAAKTIVIRDEGKGMDEKARTLLFKPKVDEMGSYGKGAGVALAIAYEMLKLTGAAISVESALGEGTVFLIECPEPLER